MPDLVSLIKAGESETVEFKETWRDSDALRELAAFANTRGGTLLVGIGDDGTFVGWTGDGKELDVLANKIADGLRIHPSILRIEEAAGQAVLRIQVSPSPTPVSYRGRYYHRVGRTLREIPPDDLSRFLMERTGTTWDAIPEAHPVAMIDADQVRRFAHLARKRLPHISEDDDVEPLLRKLGLIRADRLTRAALLLFGKDPQASFLSARVHMGRFKDAITIVDDKWFGGTLFEQVEAAMNQFRQYLQVRYVIPLESRGRAESSAAGQGLEELQRSELWDYPLTALEEAVINAVIHRDYSLLGNVEVRVFDDRVVITNPGGLPGSLTIDQLRQEEHDSIRRNPLLAQTFYFASLVEQWGTGTIRMARACEAQGLPVPEFESTGERFTVRFLKDPYTEGHLRGMGLTDRQIQIVLRVKEQGSIDNAEVQALTGVSDRTALRYLKALEEKHLLRRTRTTGRGTRYELTSNPTNPP